MISNNKPERDLAPLQNELMQREPIFHRSAFGVTLIEFEDLMASDYWEVGASGRRYDREYVLAKLEEFPPIDADSAGWILDDAAIREVGSETFLITYRLHQGERVTRRATIWRRMDGRWKILYHQGTIVERGVEAF